MSDCLRSHRWKPTRLPHPWDSPGQSTGVGCHFLLQCMKVKSESEVAQSCLTLSDPMGCSLPDSTAHGIFQARVLEWGAIAFSLQVYMYELKQKMLCYLQFFCCCQLLFLWRFIFVVTCNNGLLIPISVKQSIVQKNDNLFILYQVRASLVAQIVKNLPTMQGTFTQVLYLVFVCYKGCYYDNLKSFSEHRYTSIQYFIKNIWV